MPLMHFQTKEYVNTRVTAYTPTKYSTRGSRDTTEIARGNKSSMAENNVSPYAGCLPLLVQMPVMMALYQAILRILELRSGHFHG